MALYCGIDLHSRDCWLAMLDERLEVIWETKVGNDLEQILRLLAWVPPFAITHSSWVPSTGAKLRIGSSHERIAYKGGTAMMDTRKSRHQFISEFAGPILPQPPSAPSHSRCTHSIPPSGATSCLRAAGR